MQNLGKLENHELPGKHRVWNEFEEGVFWIDDFGEVWGACGVEGRRQVPNGYIRQQNLRLPERFKIDC